MHSIWQTKNHPATYRVHFLFDKLGEHAERTERGRSVLAAGDAKVAGREGLERFEGRGRGRLNGRGLPAGRQAKPANATMPTGSGRPAKPSASQTPEQSVDFAFLPVVYSRATIGKGRTE